MFIKSIFNPTTFDSNTNTITTTKSHILQLLKTTQRLPWFEKTDKPEIMVEDIINNNFSVFKEITVFGKTKLIYSLLEFYSGKLQLRQISLCCPENDVTNYPSFVNKPKLKIK